MNTIQVGIHVQDSFAGRSSLPCMFLFEGGLGSKHDSPHFALIVAGHKSHQQPSVRPCSDCKLLTNPG